MLKVRARGWQTCFQRLKNDVSLLIAMTPTSELRNKITELNMKLMELEDFDNKQKEVL